MSWLYGLLRPLSERHEARHFAWCFVPFVCHICNSIPNFYHSSNYPQRGFGPSTFGNEKPQKLEKQGNSKRNFVTYL
jgi:hypothetical protein